MRDVVPLNEVADQGRAGTAVEEEHLLQREAAAHDDLIDVVRPGRLGHVAELGPEREIPASARQARAHSDRKRW